METVTDNLDRISKTEDIHLSTLLTSTAMHNFHLYTGKKL